MPYFLDGNCVRKGTKEEPGETVKCHETHEEALAHLRALYVHVEDADKAVQETHGCVCPECGKVVHVALGQRCNEVRCPECEAMMTQGTSGQDDEKAVHGEGSMLGEVGAVLGEGDTGTCKCPHCGKGIPCSAKACPYCKEKIDRVERGEGEKAMSESFEQRAESIRTAFNSQFRPMSAMVSNMPASIWLVETFEDAVISEADGEFYRIAFSKAGDSYSFAPREDWVKVERKQEWVEKAAALREAAKAEWSAAAVNDLPDGCFLYVEDGEKDEGGKTTPRSKRHLPYKNSEGNVDLPHLRNALSRLGQPGTGKGWLNEDLRKRLQAKAQGILSKHGGGEKAWTVYKSTDGKWRWLGLCNWAVVDKEAEVVSEQAYRDGIAYAQKTGQWGELDLVHVNGTDVGDCDMLFIVKQGDEPPKLGAGGTWRDTPMAVGAREAVQAEPGYWGMSEKFRYNPARKVKGIYTGDIQYLKHTILEQAMAASYGTAIAVQGGETMSKELDEKTREALGKLGVSEEQIAELSEKQKALPPEENVVEKENEIAEEEVKEVAVEPEQGKVKHLIAQLATAFGIGTKKEAPATSEPEEAGKGHEVTDPAKAAEPAETKQAGGEPEGTDVGAMLRSVGAEMAKSLGELVKEQLDERDGRIAALEETVKGLHQEVTIASKSAEERVEEALRNIPTSVKVAASQVEATVDQREESKGLTFGQRPEVAEKYAEQLVAGIQRLVEQADKGAKHSV